MCGYGDDVVHCQITEYAGFNLDFLCIGFPFHFVAGFEFFPRHDIYGFEHPDAFGFQVVVEDEGHTGFAIQTAFLGFGFPFVAVTVTVEMDRLAYLDIFTDDVEDGRNLRFALFHKFVYIFLELCQLFGKGGVQGNHGAGAVGFRPYGAKLKAVAGESKRAGAVTVGVVYHQFGNLGNIRFHALLAAEADKVVFGAFLYMFQNLAQLFAEEAGYDCGRCCVCSQPVGICGAGDACLQ